VCGFKNHNFLKNYITLIKSKKKPIVLDDSKVSQKISKKELIKLIIKKKQKEKFLTENQLKYYETLIKNEIVICSGGAGVGKSHITLKAAINLLLDETNTYEKIMIVRPAVEAEEHLGALPGTIEEKMSPYAFPTFYLLNKILGQEILDKLIEEKIIEIYPLGFMRGLNVDNTILIGEEFQNTTPLQAKLVLTRIGFNSKFFISGDIEQSDKYKDKTKSGLYDMLNRLEDLDGISIFKFDKNDIVRNPIITKILERYE
jgi:phosphate starvation-inducible PhoH-like protein